MKHLRLRVLSVGLLLTLGLAACESATAPEPLEKPSSAPSMSGVTMGSGV